MTEKVEIVELTPKVPKDIMDFLKATHNKVCMEETVNEYLAWSLAGVVCAEIDADYFTPSTIA